MGVVNPTFEIFSLDEVEMIKGKIDLSVQDKLKADPLNLVKETYKYTSKTIYSPRMSVKLDETKRILVGHEKV